MGEEEKSRMPLFGLTDADVLSSEDFGRFEVIETKKGIIFKNYTGYRVFVTPYAVGTDGVAHEQSLYAWLRDLVAMKRMFAGHEDEPITEGAKETKGDLLEMAKITAEANCLYPMTVFTDREKATQCALTYIEWLTGQMEALKEAMASPAPEEDLKANAEFDAKVEAAETLRGMLQEEQQKKKRRYGRRKKEWPVA